MIPLLLLATLLPLPDVAQDQVPSVQRWTFESDDETPWVATAEGEGAKRQGTGPKREEGQLILLQPWWKLQVSAAFPAPAAQAARVVECRWTQELARGCEGIGFAWLNTTGRGAEEALPQPGSWEAPDLAGSFAIGFDARDPVNNDPFRGSGNIHDRPEHEISLHWDGAERIKKLTETEFRDGEPHQIALRLEWVPGGVLVDLRLGEEAVFDRWFLAGATPYPGRPVFGGRNTETAGWATLDDLEVSCSELFDGFPPPVEVTTLDHVLNDHAHGKNEVEVAFPENTDDFARILCTLRLDQPETRFDPWDRIAHVFLSDDAGGQVELLRYITPYNRGHEWIVDVTDFRPLLRGKRTVRQVCGTQGEGWVVSVTFHFYPGESQRLAHRIVPLWDGKCVIGNPEHPPADFFAERRIELEEGITSARVRTVVTGHGMSPNTDNAGEFMPLGRTLSINGESRHDVLWKTDNYLNPCRPQGGTWKYDRAGWAPGDVVRPWVVEVSEEAIASQALEVGYVLDEYVNENRGQTWEPFHQVTGYLVLYRNP